MVRVRGPRCGPNEGRQDTWRPRRAGCASWGRAWEWKKWACFGTPDRRGARARLSARDGDRVVRQPERRLLGGLARLSDYTAEKQGKRTRTSSSGGACRPRSGLLVLLVLAAGRLGTCAAGCGSSFESGSLLVSSALDAAHYSTCAAALTLIEPALAWYLNVQSFPR